ncbi:MAG: hypothetical protein AB1625_10470 [Acidobacteriota bacterium]
MVYGRPTHAGPSAVLPGAPPRDLAALLGVLFATWTLQFFAATAVVPALMRLSPAVWQAGWVWQLATYAFAGYGPPSVWFLLELFILYWFGTDLRRRFGRRGFWRLIAIGALAASLAAVAVRLAAGAIAPDGLGLPFQLMQGQRILMVVLIAAFAVANREATILLFFVLPLRAGWFVWLGILFGFVGFLSTRDLAGFAGICAATAATVTAASRRSPLDRLSSWWARWRTERADRRFKRLAKKRGLRVVRDDDDERRIN